MSWLSRLLHRRQEIDREIDEELRFHIETRIERYVRAGLTQEQARRKALDRFGNLDEIREAVREIELGTIESVWQDVRYGMRTLAKSPGFTTVALLSLALGIGLNSAIFSAINAVLLRPLPYKDPERIVKVYMTYNNWPSNASPADYLDWERQNQVFERMAAIEPGTRVLGGGQAERVVGLRVSASFFPILGVQPAFGRAFLPEEDKPGANVVLISNDLWRRHFASDPNILGRNITVDNSSYRVIGVMPARFRYFQGTNYAVGGDSVDVWLPYPFATNPPTNRDYFTLHAIARLRPWVTVEKAQADMGLIWQRLVKFRAAPEAEEAKHCGVRVLPILEDVAGDSRSSLLLIWGAVALVLVIACANVANLLLVRAAKRTREIAIRVAIGAGRRRIVRQLLTESVLLALAGGSAGLMLAHWSASLLNGIVLNGLLPGNMYRLDEARVDPWVLGFSLGLSLVTGLLFGLVPALRASHVELTEALTGRGSSEERRGTRLRSALVVLQVALSVVLLAGAGLMINSFWRLHQAPLGFKPDRLLTLHCVLPEAPPYVTNLGFQPVGPGSSSKSLFWKLNQQALLFPSQVSERVKQLPGIESAAVTAYGFPFVGRGMYPGFHGFYEGFKIERERATASQGEQYAANWAVTPGYFKTMGIRIVDGRDFNQRDTVSAPDVMIVNQTMAQKFWRDQASVIGKHVLVGYFGRRYEIVGVAQDIKAHPSGDLEPQIYIAQLQPERSYPPFGMENRLNLWVLVRTTSNPTAMASSVRDAIRKMDPNVSVDYIRTMEEAVADAFGPWRYTMLLLTLLGALAVLLSAMGTFGVISFAAAQRNHEIGIRMAMGAGRRDVLRLVMKSGMVLALIGILLGSGAAWWLTRLLASRLYGVTPTDPVTFASVALVLLAVALLACYLPAHRAARLDPVAALRCE